MSSNSYNVNDIYVCDLTNPKAIEKYEGGYAQKDYEADKNIVFLVEKKFQNSNCKEYQDVLTDDRYGTCYALAIGNRDIYLVDHSQIHPLREVLPNSLKNINIIERSKIKELVKYSNDNGGIEELRKLDAEKSKNQKHDSSKEQNKQPDSIENNEFLSDIGYYMTGTNIKNNHVIGRNEDIEELIATLITEDVSPLLIGKAGVGKTAIVNALAYKLANNDVPEVIKGKKIFNLSIPSFLSDISYVGQFETKFKELMQNIEDDKNTIIYIDEIHSIMGAGSTTNRPAGDFSNYLKPYLSENKIKVIGCTTNEEYDKYIAKYSAFSERFENIEIEEPSEELTLKIAFNKMSHNIHNVICNYDYEVQERILQHIIKIAAKKQQYYCTRANPRFTLSIINKALAYARVKERSNVLVEDFARALRKCNMLSKDARKREAQILLNNYGSLDNQEIQRQSQIETVSKQPELKKVIGFPHYK